MIEVIGPQGEEEQQLLGISKTFWSASPTDASFGSEELLYW